MLEDVLEQDLEVKQALFRLEQLLKRSESLSSNRTQSAEANLMHKAGAPEPRTENVQKSEWKIHGFLDDRGRRSFEKQSPREFESSRSSFSQRMMKDGSAAGKPQGSLAERLSGGGDDFGHVNCGGKEKRRLEKKIEILQHENRLLSSRLTEAEAAMERMKHRRSEVRNLDREKAFQQMIRVEAELIRLQEEFGKLKARLCVPKKAAASKARAWK
eukprot:ANDGO_03397.mRNA.1 hypothetical protein